MEERFRIEVTEGEVWALLFLLEMALVDGHGRDSTAGPREVVLAAARKVTDAAADAGHEVGMALDELIGSGTICGECGAEVEA